MNRRSFLLAGPLFALAGCFWDKQTTRSQIGDAEGDDAIKTIGDISVFDNAAGIPVSGVGLVIGLDGMGGSPPGGEMRSLLEDYLHRKKRDDAKQLLDNPNHAMVLVSGIIPAGARKGDPIDLEITLPPGSKAKSLRGGYLLATELVNYDTRNNVRNFLSQAADVTPSGNTDGLLTGHKIVVGEGPVHGLIGADPEPAATGAEQAAGDVKHA
jgi:hypothetical protein